MRAVALVDFDSGPAPREVETPVPHAGEVLVRVRAASINGVDVMIAGGMLRGMMEYEFPVVPGRDFAGVVDRAGPGAARFAEGDEVMGWVTSQTLHDGTWAEYVVAPENGSVVRKPAQLDDVAAAALPLAGLTALAAVDAVAPSTGDRVLIVGAGGGVGSIAVQLAAHTGATVVATAKPGDEARLHELGAAETVGYLDDDVVESLRAGRPLDGLIDVVSGDPDAFARVEALVRDGARTASTLGAARAGTNVMADAADPASLERLAALAASGDLTITVDRVFRLDDAAAAIDEFNRGKRGKIVLRV